MIGQFFLEQVVKVLLDKFVTPDNIKQLETALIELLKQASAKTATDIDDEAVAALAKALLG